MSPAGLPVDVETAHAAFKEMGKKLDLMTGVISIGDWNTKDVAAGVVSHRATDPPISNPSKRLSVHLHL
jgi:hypothetical protein